MANPNAVGGYHSTTRGVIADDSDVLIRPFNPDSYEAQMQAKANNAQAAMNTPQAYNEDDDGASLAIAQEQFTGADSRDILFNIEQARNPGYPGHWNKPPIIKNSSYFKAIKNAYGLYDREDINLYNKVYRYGLFHPDTAVPTLKEVLFFTKPDLSIMKRSDNWGQKPSTSDLNPDLSYRLFWNDLKEYRFDIIRMLQGSLDENTPWNYLLMNSCVSNLEIPTLASEAIETAANMYGVNLSYRASSENSDDNFDFSLEFKDTKWLETYHFFKAYEEYETLKHHGTVSPWLPYIVYKILHDQFCIYKFLLDDDMETIIYYAKFYGVYPKSLPRDTFTSGDFDGGIKYSIDFRAAFFEDMKPEILYDFNQVGEEAYNGAKYDITSYNDALGRPDNRPAVGARIYKWQSNMSPTGYVYKLKWRGDDKI
jgi:hypothetical protein